MAEAVREREPGDDDAYVEGALVPMGEAIELELADQLYDARVRAWDLMQAHGGAKSHRRTTPFFRSALTLVGKTFPAVPWLVVGVIRQSSVFVIGGEPKSAKTWTGMEASMAIATNTPMFGEFKIGMTGPVAMFLIEDEEQSIHDRLRALAASRGMTLEEAAQHLYFEERKSINLLNPDDVVDLIASVLLLPEKPVAVVLDPLRDLHSGDEDKSGEIKPVMDVLRLLRNVLGCAIILVHHAGKATKDNKSRRAAQKLRGSSAIHGALDGSLMFEDLQTDLQTYWTSKTEVETRAGRAAGKFSVRLEVKDDAQGNAEVATWRFSREGFGKDDPPPPNGLKVGPNEIKIISVLRRRWQVARSSGLDGPEPLGQRDLGDLAGIARSSAADALKRVFDAGKAYHLKPERGVRTAAQQGWVYRPTADEEDAFPDL